MSNIVDNTGTQSLVTVAGAVWTQTKYSSYTNFFSVDGQFVVTQSPKRFWSLFTRTDDGYRKVAQVFFTARDAQVHAASLIEMAA